MVNLMNKDNRQDKLKEIILKLHQGHSQEDVENEFKKHFENVSTEEIAAMEQSLITEEGITIQEIQRLCDIHAAVLGTSVYNIHQPSNYEEIKGHPVKVFKDENRVIEILIEEEIEPYLNIGSNNQLMLRIAYDRLLEIDKHYARKENLLFPKLERLGITAPPKVMWGIDDEIRNEIKDIINNLGDPNYKEETSIVEIKANILKIKDMIFKEETILLPLVLEHMTHFDWILVDASSDEIGYFLDFKEETWLLEEKDKKETKKPDESGVVNFDAGSLTFEEVNQILNTVPLDMTFVDKDGRVKYFTQGTERIFHRPKTVIGRDVHMCHPPQSVDIVENIIESFRSGKKDSEQFWIQMKDKFIHIRYFAVRSKIGEYLGTLEVSQDIKPLRALEGEKRIQD